jgi:uncharacterized protein (DUF1800 family)
MIAAEIAANRFGLGAVVRVKNGADVKNDLKRQLRDFDPRPDVLAALPNTEDVSRLTGEYLDGLRAQGVIGDMPVNDSAITPQEKRKRAAELQKHIRKFFGKSAREFYLKAVNARLETAVESKTDFAERLVHFWANHFAISVDKPLISGFAGLHEFEAIRPHVMGKFADLLRSAVLHPGMLLYLDQAQSIGAQSRLALAVNRPRRKRKLGLNENLAREILELHTLGVNGGYNQSDVTAFANALTGWTVSGLSRGAVARALNIDNSYGQPVFVNALHQPGPARVMGKAYAAKSRQQSIDILDDLARHPATANHIAQKLAQHFYGDNPPDTLVKRLRDDFANNDGDLQSLYAVLIDSPELWQAPASKFKTPWEWTISIMRAFPDNQLTGRLPENLLRSMNHIPWRPGSPAGYGDKDADWISPDALYKRVQYANLLAVRLKGTDDIQDIAEKLFPATLSNTTRVEIARAASPRQALALLLVSPEFLRR